MITAAIISVLGSLQARVEALVVISCQGKCIDFGSRVKHELNVHHTKRTISKVETFRNFRSMHNYFFTAWPHEIEDNLSVGQMNITQKQQNRGQPQSIPTLEIRCNRIVNEVKHQRP